jgi:hypothetical protein
MDNLDPLDLEECRRHLKIADRYHVECALVTLMHWDKLLSDDEMKHVPKLHTAV